MGFNDPAFWRAGAISVIAVMSVALISGIGTPETIHLACPMVGFLVRG